jgi:hypothetical protein
MTEYKHVWIIWSEYENVWGELEDPQFESVHATESGAKERLKVLIEDDRDILDKMKYYIKMTDLLK